jgi:hypothetical protein
MEGHTAPLTVRSSPRKTVVPQATNSFWPSSVLRLSSVTISRELTNSFHANSYLKQMNRRIDGTKWLHYPSITNPSTGETSSKEEQVCCGSEISGPRMNFMMKVS